MLGRSDIVSQLPRAFCDALRRAQKCNFIYVLADALGKIENPLVLVNLRNNFSKFSCLDAIFVSMKVSRCKEDILQALFPEKGVTTNSCSNDDHDQEKVSKFWEILDGLELLETGKGEDAMHLVSIIPIIKEEVDEKFQLISFAMASFKENNHQDEGKILLEANSMLDALNQLSSALDISEGEFDVKVSTIDELSKALRSRRQEVEPLLKGMFLKNEINAVGEASEISSAVTEVDENSKADRNNSEEDKMKDDAYPTITSIKADDENNNSEEDKDER
ncbi:hypothetical protein F0562_032396 [Nyssa sinensis]|uniref:Uncharacterized protein n=1 Tax=Nyssa sinensis TaxID=561372 RepID=A0A5J5AQ22_9ASTE|nr:hypothetical protein F0562_032396 [Nyssa sinensis]